MTHEFAVKIGADGWAPDASSAVEVAKAVVDTARGKTAISGFIDPDVVAAARAGAGRRRHGRLRPSRPADSPMRLAAITCDMLLRPVERLAAESPHEVSVATLSASLHAEPATLRERIQARIDVVEPGADAVVLAYGLCGGATAGIEAPRRAGRAAPRA